MCSILMLYPHRIQPKTKTRAQRLSPKQNDNTCLCSCVRWNMVLRDFVYIYIYGTQGIYIYICTMHNMPVVSECKLNQVDIVGEPRSTSV